jgi:hypothetical protein
MMNAVFGILCRAALVRTYVSEVRIASIIRVKRIGELGKNFGSSNRGKLRRSMDDGDDRFSETSVLTGATQLHIPGDGILHQWIHRALPSL